VAPDCLIREACNLVSVCANKQKVLILNAIISNIFFIIILIEN